MENTFLPTNEKPPEGNYMKFQEGENTFRVLSSAIVGWEYWNKDNKPIRLRTQPTQTPTDIKVENGKQSPIKYFWAFVVFNQKALKQQILEVTQNSIQQAIRALVQNKNWGDPKAYDITVTRTGSGLDTEYSVMPNPKIEFVKDLFILSEINLDALFTGEDPFKAKTNEAEPPDFLK